MGKQGSILRPGSSNWPTDDDKMAVALLDTPHLILTEFPLSDSKVTQTALAGAADDPSDAVTVTTDVLPFAWTGELVETIPLTGNGDGPMMVTLPAMGSGLGPTIVAFTFPAIGSGDAPAATDWMDTGSVVGLITTVGSFVTATFPATGSGDAPAATD